MIRIVLTAAFFAAVLYALVRFLKRREADAQVSLAKWSVVFILLSTVCLVFLIGLPKGWIYQPAFLIGWNIVVWACLICGLALATLSFLKFFDSPPSQRLKRYLILAFVLVPVFMIGFALIIHQRFPELKPDKIDNGFSVSDYFGYLKQVQVAGSSLPTRADIYYSPRFDYSVDLKNTDWVRWQKYFKDYPMAEYGGRHPREIYFVIIPYYLPGGKPDLKAMVDAAFHGIGMDSQAAWKGKWTREESNGFEGFVFDFEKRLRQVEYHYRWKFLTDGQFAYLMGAWGEAARMSQNAALIDEMFRRTRLRDRGGRVPDRDQLSFLEKIRQAAWYRQIGLSLYQEGKVSESLPYFRHAHALRPNHPAGMQMLIATLRELGNSEEADALTDRYEIITQEAFSMEKALEILARDDVRESFPDDGSEEIIGSGNTDPTGTVFGSSQQTQKKSGDTVRGQAGNLNGREATASGPAGNLTDALQYQLLQRGIYFEKNQPTRWVDRRIIEVINAEALRQLKHLSFPYDARTQDLHLDYFKIDKRAASAENFSTVSDMIMPTGNAGTKALHVNLPALESGTVFEIQITLTDKNASNRFPFISYSFQTTYPAMRHEFYIASSNLDNILATSDGSLSQSKAPGKITWYPRSPTPQPGQAPAMIKATVWAGENYGSWQQAADAYLNRLGPLLVPGEADIQQASKIVGSSSENPEKISALFDFLQDHFKLLSTTRRSIQDRPRNSTELSKSPQGNSVDLSLYLLRLLKAAGMDAVPVLVRGQGEVIAGIPHPGQFDYMMLRVSPAGTGRPEEVYIDVADPLLPWGEIRKSWRGKGALVLERQKAALTQIQ
ncbi:hypothetical protein N9K06_00305 [Omnitrophica bacterium]|nr:hypothetical protein [Candidatus Omnitrophota bacterium]